MMRAHRRPTSLPLLFVLATTSLVVSTTDAVPSKAPPNSSPNPRAVQDSPAAPRHTNAAVNGSVLSPAASQGNNSFPDLTAVYLWTRSHAPDANYEVLDPNLNQTITNSSFLPNSKTYLLLHGFLDKGTADWILKLKTKLLDLEDCNVLAVQYHAGVNNTDTDFSNVSARIPAVGAQTAGLLELLVKLQKQDLRQLHIIGHCLGAHVGGIAGFTVQSTVGRITGLDPAGLTFNNASRTKRLSDDDADFVDVIHTSGCNNIHRWGDCMGIHIEIGHSDFWPNGGYYQPACHRSGKHKIDDVCNHRVAQAYFLESFSYGTDTTLFLARPDDTYEHFCHSVQCGDFPQYMGINARKVDDQSNFFLNTSAAAPYALADPSCPNGDLPTGMSATAITLIVVAVLLGLVVVVPGLVLATYRACTNYRQVAEADAKEPLIRGQATEHDDQPDARRSAMERVARGLAHLAQRSPQPPVEV